MEKTPLSTFPVANDLCFHKDLQSQKTGVELIHLPDIRSTSDMPQKGSQVEGGKFIYGDVVGLVLYPSLSVSVLCT